MYWNALSPRYRLFIFHIYPGEKGANYSSIMTECHEKENFLAAEHMSGLVEGWGAVSTKYNQNNQHKTYAAD